MTPLLRQTHTVPIRWSIAWVAGEILGKIVGKIVVLCFLPSPFHPLSSSFLTVSYVAYKRFRPFKICVQVAKVVIATVEVVHINIGTWQQVVTLET